MKIQSPKSSESTGVQKGLRIIGNILLYLPLLWFGMQTVLIAYGWIVHANSYGAVFATYGWLLVAAMVGMTAATVCYTCKKDLAAVIAGSVSGLLLLIVGTMAIGAAKRAGWSGQTEATFGKMAYRVWRDGLFGNLWTFLLLMGLSLTRYCSYDARTARAKRRREQETAPAPSILGDDEPPAT